MRRLVLARHAETEFNVSDVLNGDPAVEVRLTDRGREQARALGHAVGAVDVVVHTSLARTAETAELAWADAPRVVLAELDEIRYGVFERGTRTDEFRSWCAAAAPADAAPGGGESRLDVAARLGVGLRAVAARAEDTVAVVAHGIQVAYVELALAGRPPVPVLPPVAPAVALVVDAARVREAVGVLERWVEEPAWR